MSWHTEKCPECGENVEVRNVTIETTDLRFESHVGGYFSLNTMSGSVGQSATYGLSLKVLNSIQSVLGVERWEDIAGEHARVKASHTKIHALGNVTDEDKWIHFENKELY